MICNNPSKSNIGTNAKICFQSSSSLLPVRFQSASIPLPFHFQSTSSLLPVCFQSITRPLPVHYHATSRVLQVCFQSSYYPSRFFKKLKLSLINGQKSTTRCFCENAFSIGPLCIIDRVGFEKCALSSKSLIPGNG